MRWTLRTAIGVGMAGDVSAFGRFAQPPRGVCTLSQPACKSGRFALVGHHAFCVGGRPARPQAPVAHLLTRSASCCRTRFPWSRALAPCHCVSPAWPGLDSRSLGCACWPTSLVRYYREGGSLPGFPFLASVISIFSGAQLFALGVIGEYLARIHFRTMDRPVYAVRLTTAVRADK